MQILRIDGLARATTVLKLLPHATPSLPSGVKGIIRFDRLPSAATIFRLFLISDDTWDGIIIDGDRILVDSQ